jgi:hypothetical protein
MDMANSSTLSWFLQTVQTYFPSQYVLLSLWDHNWGWHSGSFQLDYTSSSATMSYGSLYHRLLHDQIASIPVDVVAYDACVSSQIEVLHTWRKFAHFFAGSQDYVGWKGVDYSVVIRAIYENPDITPEDLSVTVAQTILTDPYDGCASALKLNEIFDELVMQVDLLAKLFLQNLDDIRDNLTDIRLQTPQTPSGRSDHFHRDLYGMATGVATTLSAYPEIAQVALNIQKVLNSTLLYNEVSSTRDTCTGGNGLTIYWPKSGNDPSSDYFETSFAMATSWDEFLIAF